MKITALIFFLFIQLIGHSQLYVSGNEQACEGDVLKIYAHGDTSYAWAWVAQPDSIISSSHFFEFEPKDTSSLFIYSPSDTLYVPIFFGGNQCICKCFVPNVFTPNGDIFNDMFFPVVNCGETLGIRMTICNRMGKVVFDETAHWISGWDGTDQQTGQKLAQGMYGWQVSFITEDGITQHYQGHVFLLR